MTVIPITIRNGHQHVSWQRHWRDVDLLTAMMSFRDVTQLTCLLTTVPSRGRQTLITKKNIYTLSTLRIWAAFNTLLLATEDSPEYNSVRGLNGVQGYVIAALLTNINTWLWEPVKRAMSTAERLCCKLGRGDPWGTAADPHPRGSHRW